MYHPPVLIELGKPARGITGRADWRLNRIQELVASESGHSRLTLGHFSDQLGISTGQLSRLFVHVTGHRFRNFAMAHRLQRASRLLRQTRQPIKQIAADLGYSHTGDFCRRFKEVFGQTPNEYRQHTRADKAFNKSGGPPATSEGPENES